MRIPLPLVAAPSSAPSPAFDLLRLPVAGRFLKWRHVRPTLQLALLLLAGVIIYDGLAGPQISSLNLAGVVPWIHWRGFLVLVLLVAGNFFCMACPFLLPRTLARRWLPAGRAWPRWLRGKWLAVALLALFLWAYEALALWDSPWWTAWIALAYFAAAFVIDGFFRGASFCKYVCPVGQFNFAQSMLSPLDVRVRDPAVCQSCVTRDCVRGSADVPGCELHLFPPRKAGNMDCTFCLDCVHACPHDNIAMAAQAPGAQLWHDGHRSGVGRFGKRPDLAVLVLLLTFGAFANAAGMVAPVVAWQERLCSSLGWPPLAVVTLGYALALLLVPLLLIGTAAACSRWWGGEEGSCVSVATRYAYALLPLGAAMWLTHYAFHLFTSLGAVLPAAERFAADAGLTLSGVSGDGCACCLPAPAWLLRLEILALDLGLLLSLYTGYRIARGRHARPGQALRALAPWALLLLALFAVGIWIVFQPMQMRGTM